MASLGALFVLTLGLAYLEWRRRAALAAAKAMAAVTSTSPKWWRNVSAVNPVLALLPLVVVGVANKLLTLAIPQFYGAKSEVRVGARRQGDYRRRRVDHGDLGGRRRVDDRHLVAFLLLAWKAVSRQFAEGTKSAISGALLASMNTASEYGFGAVIAALPGFLVISEALKAIPDPLLNEAITVTSLAGITGSASGGLSIALAAMAEQFTAAANAAGIPLEVLHRVASMASGGMDTLPHNGAVITVLAVTGLTHRQSYKDIFAITCIKTLAVFFVIAVYYATGWV